MVPDITRDTTFIIQWGQFREYYSDIAGYINSLLKNFLVLGAIEVGNFWSSKERGQSDIDRYNITISQIPLRK